MRIESPGGRPYHVSLLFESTADGHEGWVAKVDELPGCVSQGPTVEAALHNLDDAATAWLEYARDHETPAPEPRSAGEYSGRFLLRTPSSLHEALVREAAREGVSLNQFATTVLGAAVGWRMPQAFQPERLWFQSNLATAFKQADAPAGAAPPTPKPQTT